jgi:hypothetical protein
MNLRQKLIHLAHAKPQFRQYLLPILKQSAQYVLDPLELALRQAIDDGFFPGFTGNLKKLWGTRVGLLLEVLWRDKLVRHAYVELIRLKEDALKAHKKYDASPLVTPDFFTETLADQQERMREEMPMHADGFNWKDMESQRDKLVVLVERAERELMRKL